MFAELVKQIIRLQPSWQFAYLSMGLLFFGPGLLAMMCFQFETYQKLAFPQLLISGFVVSLPGAIGSLMVLTLLFLEVLKRDGTLDTKETRILCLIAASVFGTVIQIVLILIGWSLHWPVELMVLLGFVSFIFFGLPVVVPSIWKFIPTASPAVANNDEDKKPFAILFGIVLAVLVVWLFSPLLTQAWAYLLGIDSPGVLGDSFGTFTSLATAIALVFAAITFTTELRKMREDSRKERESREHEKKTAAISALTVLADWQYKMMSQGAIDLQDHHRVQCEAFANRSLKILCELDQEFDSARDLKIVSPIGVLRRRLSGLLAKLDELDRLYKNSEPEEPIGGQISYLLVIAIREFDMLSKIDADYRLGVLPEQGYFDDEFGHYLNDDPIASDCVPVSGLTQTLGNLG